MPSRTGSKTFPSTHPRSGATTAPAKAPWASAVAECRPQLEAWVAVESLRPQQVASAAVECRWPQQAASAAVECRWPQQAASAVVETPVSVEAEELPEATQESRVVDRTPRVSRYSGSLFRQPLLLASCPNLGLVGIAQNAQQKQGIQTHSYQTVNGPFAQNERESTRTSALNKYP